MPSSNTSIPTGINLPFVRTQRSTRSLSASWSPHNVLATIASESVFLAFSYDTETTTTSSSSLCLEEDSSRPNQNNYSSAQSSSSSSPSLSIVHEINDRAGQGAIPIDARWHPRLTPNCFPAQAAIAILYSDAVVDVHFVTLESASKVLVDRVSRLVPGEKFEMVRFAVAGENEKNKNEPTVSSTFCFEWIGGGSEEGKNAGLWGRLALFSHGMTQFVRLVPPANRIGPHKCQLLQQVNEGNSFRPVASSMVVLPKRFQSDVHQVAETVIAVLCGCTNSVRFYAESTIINHRVPMTRLITGSTSVLDLGEYLPAVSSISISTTNCHDRHQQTSSSKNVTSLNQLGNYFTLCAVGPGHVFAITYATLVVPHHGNASSNPQSPTSDRPQNSSLSSLSATTPTFATSLRKIAIHRQSTPPYVALPCSSSNSTTIPLELTSMTIVGEVYSATSLNNQQHCLRFLAFSPHEIIQIDVPILSCEEMLNRVKGIQKDIFSTSTTMDALLIRVIASSESDATIESSGMKFYRMILGLAVHPTNKNYWSVFVRGMWTRVTATSQTWLVVSSINSYDDENDNDDDLIGNSSSSNLSMKNNIHHQNSFGNAAATERQAQLVAFFQSLQKSIFGSRRRKLIRSALQQQQPSTVLPLLEVKELLATLGGLQNHQWPLPHFVPSTGLAPTVERSAQEAKNALVNNAMSIIEQSIQKEYYGSGAGTEKKNDDDDQQDATNSRRRERTEEDAPSKNSRMISFSETTKLIHERFAQVIEEIDKSFRPSPQQQQLQPEQFQTELEKKVTFYFSGKCIGRPLFLSIIYSPSSLTTAKTSSSDQQQLLLRKRALHELILPHCCRAIQHSPKSAATVARAFSWLKLYCQEHSSKRPEFCQALLARAETTISRSENAKVILAASNNNNNKFFDTCPVCGKKEAIGMKLDLNEGFDCLSSSSAGTKNHCALISPTSFRAVYLYGGGGSDGNNNENQQKEENVGGGKEGEDEEELNLVAAKCVVCGCGEQLHEKNERALCLVCSGYLST